MGGKFITALGGLMKYMVYQQPNKVALRYLRPKSSEFITIVHDESLLKYSENLLKNNMNCVCGKPVKLSNKIRYKA